MVDPRPIFVVGMPRSGTTLLAGLLSAHSKISIGPETDYFNMVWKPLEREKGFEQWDVVANYLSRWFQKPTMQPMNLPEEQLLSQFLKAWENQQLSHQVILSTVMAQYAESHRKSIWGEKTPNHFMYVPAIKKVFPEARIVSIVRDPRDVHLSLEKVPWSRGNAFNHAVQWREYQVIAERYQYLYGPSFRQVRFEDLIRDPAAVLRQLTQSLDLPFESDMLKRYQNETLFDPAKEPWKKQATMPIDPNNQGKWREKLAPDDLGIFSRVCGRYLKRLGYALPDGAKFVPSKAMSGLDHHSLAWWARTIWRVSRNRDPWVDQPIMPPGTRDVAESPAMAARTR